MMKINFNLLSLWCNCIYIFSLGANWLSYGGDIQTQSSISQPAFWRSIFSGFIPPALGGIDWILLVVVRPADERAIRRGVGDYLSLANALGIICYWNGDIAHSS